MARPDYLDWKQSTLKMINKIRNSFKSIGENLEKKLNTIEDCNLKISDQSSSSLLLRLELIDSAEGDFHQSSNTLCLANRRLTKRGHNIEIFISLNYLQKNLPETWVTKACNPSDFPNAPTDISADSSFDACQKSPVVLAKDSNGLCSPIGIDQFSTRLDLTINTRGRASNPFINLTVAVSKIEEQFKIYPARGARLCNTTGLSQFIQSEILKVVNERLEGLFPIQLTGNDSSSSENSDPLVFFDNPELKELIGSPQFYSSQIDQGLSLFGRSGTKSKTNIEPLKISLIDFDYAVKLSTDLLRRGIEDRARKQVNELLGSVPSEAEKELEIKSEIQPSKTALLLTINIKITSRVRIDLGLGRATVFMTVNIAIRLLVVFSAFSNNSVKGIKYAINREGNVSYSYKARTRRSDSAVNDRLAKEFYNNSFFELEKTVNQASSELAIEENIPIPGVASIKLRLDDSIFVLLITTDKESGGS